MERMGKMEGMKEKKKEKNVVNAINATVTNTKSVFLFTFLMLASFMFVSLVNADQLIIEYGPGKGIGESCSVHYECTTWLCVNSLCAACSSDSDCSGTTNLCVSPNCVPCTTNEQCSTLWCDSGVCRSCTSDVQCPTGLCDEATGKCERCTKPSDCPSGFCDNGYCKSCTNNNQCTFGVCSAGVCKSCSEVGCPGGLKCNAADGKCYCKDNGENCAADSECCSGKCAGGKCIPSLFVGGQRASPAASGAGGSASASGETRVVREVERKTTSPFLVNVFGWARKKVEAYSTCIRGARCSTSADCCGADCVDGYCLCSTSACATTGECCSGYCEEGRCVAPPTTSLFISEAIKKPLSSQVGCSGLIEECLPGEYSCISLCNGLTAVLLIVAGGVGAFIWRKFEHPVFGIAGAFIPIFVGLVTYPFVGAIIGLIIVAMMTRL